MVFQVLAGATMILRRFAAWRCPEAMWPHLLAAGWDLDAEYIPELLPSRHGGRSGDDGCRSSAKNGGLVRRLRLCERRRHARILDLHAPGRSPTAPGQSAYAPPAGQDGKA
jgi:hypothetical protein